MLQRVDEQPISLRKNVPNIISTDSANPSKMSPATVHKVRTSFEVISRDHKKLLLPAQIAVHGLSICANAQGLQRGRCDAGVGKK
jgi:hypothetical protein